MRYVFGPDRTAPSTSLTATSSASPGSAYTGSWTSADVTVTVAPPVDAGLRATRYRVDFGAAEQISAPLELPFTTEGYHDVMAWSTDDAGNAERPKHLVVAIDRTPPESSSDAAAAYAGQAVVKFVAADNASGVLRTEWRLVGADAWTAGSSATLSTPGSYALEFRAVDRAGNVEDPNAVSFDVLPLHATALALKTTSHNVKYGATTSIEGTLTTEGARLRSADRPAARLD